MSADREVPNATAHGLRLTAYSPDEDEMRIVGTLTDERQTGA